MSVTNVNDFNSGRLDSLLDSTGFKTIDTIPPAVHLAINLKDIPIYFSHNRVPDLKDIVVYVRNLYPNPRQRVILECEDLLPEKELKESLIYVDGVNDNSARDINGLGEYCYFPIKVTNELVASGAEGFENLVNEYKETYDIVSCDILVYGTDVELLSSMWEIIRELEIPNRIYFPFNVFDVLTLFENGLNLAPYAERLASADAANSLTSSLLKDTVQELTDLVKSGKTALQDFEQTRSIYAKWLTAVLTHKLQLSPVYQNSFITEYVSLGVGYPFEKLSMYERIMFLDNLPSVCGYIGKNTEFRCIFKVLEKLYPHPELVVSMKTGEIIKGDLSRFERSKLNIIDYRRNFLESPTYFPKVKEGVAQPNSRDIDVDDKLVKLFMKITDMAERDDIYLSIRNTVMARVNKELYIVYYSESCGVRGVLVSDYFGAFETVVQEEDFRNLIDVKLVLALIHQESMNSTTEGIDAFNEIMVQKQSSFRPAIPPYVNMVSELARLRCPDLSYYDRRLRCDYNILPIVTHRNSKLKPKVSIFDDILISNVRRDTIAGPTISAFGTLNMDRGRTVSLPVSIESFKGCKLL